MTSGIGTFVFFALAAITLAGGVIVAFSKNIVRSAFSLLATFIGVAGLYAMLAADFVAIIQVLVYVGGILILILFAVMLTSHITDAKVSNASLGILPGAGILVSAAGLLIYVAISAPWPIHPLAPPKPITASIGDALLGAYVLPFELVSVLLFAALLGAVTLAKGREKPKAAPQAKTGEEPE
jgi:NAD(P)H-quinone oxidoreductase subunit 6